MNKLENSLILSLSTLAMIYFNCSNDNFNKTKNEHHSSYNRPQARHSDTNEMSLTMYYALIQKQS